MKRWIRMIAGILLGFLVLYLGIFAIIRYTTIGRMEKAASVAAAAHDSKLVKLTWSQNVVGVLLEGPASDYLASSGSVLAAVGKAADEKVNGGFMVVYATEKTPIYTMMTPAWSLYDELQGRITETEWASTIRVYGRVMTTKTKK